MNNPYGDSSQYRPDDGSGTRTTNAAVTTAVGTTTAQPFVGPSGVPISDQSSHMSGGAIAGTVLGILGALGLAGLLGWCWRRKRASHVPVMSNTTYVGHGPTRTVVSEKVEPLVVNSVDADQTYHAASIPVAATAAGVGAAAGAAGGSAYASRSQQAGGSTSYTTTTPSDVPVVAAGTAAHAGYDSRSQPTSPNYTTTTSGVPAVSASHAQPSTIHSTATGQPGSTSTYTTSGGNVHQPSGTTNYSTTYTPGSNGNVTTQPDSTTNTTYNTATTSSGGNTIGQAGDKAIYSSSDGYNPKPRN